MGTWRPQVAVVLGNDSPFYTRAGHDILPNWVSDPLRNVLPAMGTPMDVLVLDDLARENLPDYRLFVFLDIPCVSPEQKAMVHHCLSQRKALAYFHGLPSLINGSSIDTQHISELTGIQLCLLGGKPQAGKGRRMSSRFTNFEHPLVQGVTPSTTLGDHPVDAACFVTDPEATILGTMSLKGRASMACKAQPEGWTSVYSTLAGAPPVFFRNMANMAGVHVFTSQDAVIDACDNLLMVHQIGPGPLQVLLHRDWECAADRITGRTWEVVDGCLTLEGAHGTTHLLGPAE